jgi:ribosomal-protein-serine acetyltransferase
VGRSGVLVGGVMFTNFDAANETCELGCWLEPGAKGRGPVTAACKVLLDWAFTDRGIHRAEWHCRADNESSVAVAKRLGMTFEGVLREPWKVDGFYYGSQVWSLLSTDRTVRSRLRPAPTNFLMLVTRLPGMALSRV